jgi:hypothetical protein
MIIELEMNEMEMVNGGFDLGKCVGISLVLGFFGSVFYSLGVEVHRCYSGDCEKLKEASLAVLLGGSAIVGVFVLEFLILALCPNRHPGPIQGWE